MPCAFGKLKVVLPSPAPYVVLIAVNKAEYVVRDTALPSQLRYPLGAVVPAYGKMAPEGTVELAADCQLVLVPSV